MPTAFQQELVTLAHRLADLCGLVAMACEEATRAALESDLTLGGRAREQAAAAAALGAACEDQACALLALHAPREEDVKAVVAAVHTAADLTRMGGLAREVAQARRPVPSAARPVLARLASDSVAVARALGELLAGGDGSGLDEAVALATAAGRELRAWAGRCEWPGAAIDVVLLGEVYDRFARIAVGIARRTAGFAVVGA
ncbi:phosphate uptake regulator PhoU [Amycolatopsis sp. OK19-0408]|uniref:Phosphate uptake regulator PhoU n=1 Tax=Amycolatopsis iheyensis TaxID=2945988 RepID=A0A9X2NFC9_9PSEU|nr:PhoU domain-containing protein [Amycolatopsis iheyensis]MCR6486732.1 phosphate uptake regulator PhoU [Amycolatopsis iheyensis]